MKRLRLAMRMLRRNALAGESRVLIAALFIAVASVTTVGFFADRVQAALNRQANELLGGDLVVIADQPLPPTFIEAARKQSLTTAETRTFPSMVSAAGGVNLAEIKAVSTGFPLRGRYRVSDAPGEPEREIQGSPAPGSVWVGMPLNGRIGVKVGDLLSVGNAKLKVDALITREPDSVLDYFGIAPRVLLNLADLPATGLVQVGSRVTHRLLVAGEANAVQRFRDEMKPAIARGQRMEGVRDARSEVRVSLERAQRFLGLASLLSVVLASVAVALAARRFSQRQVDGAAMMRCLGASQADIFVIHGWQFLMLGAGACVAGGVAGFFAQGILARWLIAFFTVELPFPGPMPAVQGAVIGLVLLLGFTLPPLLGLRNVSTLRVLRRDLAVAEPLRVAAYLLGLGALCALIVWQAGDVKMGSIALGGFAAAIVVAALAGYGLIRAVAGLRGNASGPWRYGLANLRRRTGASLVQIIALGIGIMAMLMLTIVRTDLIAKWQQSLPADAPNRFAINIQTDQMPLVKAYFAELRMTLPDLYPMVRGRLVAINDQPIAAAVMKDERTRRQLEREFNLSWAKDLRADNKILSGSWWKPDDTTPQFSVEEYIAKTAGIKVGDSLTWDIAGSRFSAKVTNIRKVDWDSMKANFYVIASPGVLENYPASWITGFHLEPGNEEVVTKLVQRFSNISVIDLSAIMNQVKKISDEVSRAVEFVFLFAIAAGLVVLFAAISATQDERVYEGAIMRTLGASRRQMVILQLSEFLTIGLLAGSVAALGSVVLAMVLSNRVFGVAYEFNWVVPVVGLFAGGFGVAVAGVLGTRRAIESPPLQTIRAVT